MASSLGNYLGTYYQGKKVFVTGHTGFKGSWMCAILLELGAKVLGYSLNPPINVPNHFGLLNLDLIDVRADIRNRKVLFESIKDFNPDLIFHFAAQPLVLNSYYDPELTWSSNLTGTLNLIEICRQSKNIALVVVTSDKVYDVHYSNSPKQVGDPLGGEDPYSASKASVELLVRSYRNSTISNPKSFLATVRAGNVIGGGDWSEFRIIPDIVRAWNKSSLLTLQNPDSVRPWQHVLDCVNGYLLVGSKAISCEKKYEGAWNFGPKLEDHISVIEIVKRIQNKLNFDFEISSTQNIHESKILILDSNRSKELLSWSPKLEINKSLELTIDWYREFYENGNIRTYEQIDKFLNSNLI